MIGNLCDSMPFRFTNCFLSAKNVSTLISYTASLWYSLVTHKCKDKLEKHQRYCARVMLNDEDDYETRLSILKFDELNVHTQILCFRFGARAL